MFTRCCSLSAAEEKKVKQNQGEREEKPGTWNEGEGKINAVKGKEKWREMCIPLGICGKEHAVSRMLCLGWEKCVIKVSLMFCCIVLFCSEDIQDAQVHIRQNVLQTLHSQGQPADRQTECGTTSLLDSNTVTPLMQNPSMVTNTRKLMSCLTRWSFLILPVLCGFWPCGLWKH